MNDDFEAKARLREALVHAARRELEAEAPTRRRRRRRSSRGLLAAVAGLVVVCGAAATAGTLISVGDPEPQRNAKPERYRPATAARLGVVAPDTPLPWAARPYESAAGEQCVLAGQVRSGRLGAVRDGTFRPYAASVSGPCGDLGKLSFLVDRRVLGDRTVIYGRARPTVRRMVVRQPGEPDAVATVGRGGTFLLVFRGSVDFSRAKLFGRDAAGRTIEG